MTNIYKWCNSFNIFENFMNENLNLRLLFLFNISWIVIAFD